MTFTDILRKLYPASGDARRRTGQTGEDIAVAYLRKKGYVILDRNFRCPVGELDIVAQKQQIIVFVEVKTRRKEKFGPPELAVDARKRGKIEKLAAWYMKGKGKESAPVRFDVIAVSIYEGEKPQVNHIENAFQ